jgi:hypothetical protein
LDFEYFGWDDPAKAVADFVWHPAMTLDAQHVREFLAVSAATYGRDRAYTARLDAHVMLYGLRWSLIVLNEFLPERWARRVAAGHVQEHDVAKRIQLGKAVALLDRVAGMLEKGTSQ